MTSTSGLIYLNPIFQQYFALNAASSSNPNSGATASTTFWGSTSDTTHPQYGNGTLRLVSDPTSPVWNSSTAYPAGYEVFSPLNNSSYRSKVAVASGGVDPAAESYFNLSTISGGGTQVGDLQWDRLSFPSSQAILSFPQSGGFALPWSVCEIGYFQTNTAQQTIKVILESAASIGTGISNFSAVYDIVLSAQSNSNQPVYWAPNSMIGFNAIDYLEVRTVCDATLKNRLAIRHASSNNQIALSAINITIVYWGSNTTSPYFVWESPITTTDTTLIAPTPQTVQYSSLPFAVSTSTTHPNWAVGQSAIVSASGNGTTFNCTAPIYGAVSNNLPWYDGNHFSMANSVMPWQSGGYYDLGAQASFLGQVYQSVTNTSINATPPVANFVNIITLATLGTLWSSASTYSQGSWVYYTSTVTSFYVALSSVAANVIPSSNPTFWAQMSWSVPVWGPEYISTTFGKLVVYSDIPYIFIGAGTAPAVPIMPPGDAINWLAVTSNVTGTWSSATAYTAGQISKLNGIVYAAIAANTNQNPATSPASWVILNYNPWQWYAGACCPSKAQVKNGTGTNNTYYLVTASAGVAAPNVDTVNWRVLGGIYAVKLSANLTNLTATSTLNFTLIKQGMITQVFCTGMTASVTTSSTNAVALTLTGIPTYMMPSSYGGVPISGQGNSPGNNTVREMCYEVVSSNASTTSVNLAFAYADAGNITLSTIIWTQFNASWASGTTIKISPFSLSWLNASA